VTETWTLVYGLFTGCAELVAKLGHTAETPRIHRSQQYKLIKNQDHIITFKTEDFELTEATSLPKNTALYVNILSKIDDRDAEEIAEIILTELDRKYITDDNLYLHGDIYWDNYKTPPEWDENNKCWFIEMRFKLPVSKK